MDTKKKVILFIAQAVIIGLVYGLVLWLLDLVFGTSPYSAKSIILQSVVFGFIFTAISWWWQSRKKKKKK